MTMRLVVLSLCVVPRFFLLSDLGHAGSPGDRPHGLSGEGPCSVVAQNVFFLSVAAERA